MTDHTWNHRVIHHKGEYGEWYAIHEVHYEDDRVISMTIDDICPNGCTVEELREELGRMLRACDAPVLEYDMELGGH